MDRTIGQIRMIEKIAFFAPLKIEDKKEYKSAKGWGKESVNRLLGVAIGGVVGGSIGGRLGGVIGKARGGLINKLVDRVLGGVAGAVPGIIAGDFIAGKKTRRNAGIKPMTFGQRIGRGGVMIGAGMVGADVGRAIAKLVKGRAGGRVGALLGGLAGSLELGAAALPADYYVSRHLQNIESVKNEKK